MNKLVKYQGIVYPIEIKWVGESYHVRCNATGGSISIPMDCLNNIEKIKPFIKQAIEYRHELINIDNWDGIL